VFNPSAGLGSAADWQPIALSSSQNDSTCTQSILQPGQWLHVVVEYQTLTTPSQCSSTYPGTINIWVNGVQQDFAYHEPTGCMSQHDIIPTANNSPLNIGTMTAYDTWFPGAIGKVAIYNYLLSQTQINSHFTAMTGAGVSGSCGQDCTIPVPTQLGNLSVSPTAVSSATVTPYATPTPIYIPPTTTPVPTFTPTLKPISTPTPTPVGMLSNGLLVTQKIYNTWTGGYCANVYVKNTTTSTVNWWNTSFTVNTNVHVYQVWGASYSQSGTTVFISAIKSDKTINPGKTITGVGYCANN
jgi:cellulase/cellobiase CelA1